MILICKHGRKITVQIETYDPGCWDDGIIRYTSDGYEIHGSIQADGDGEYLTVTGCRYCNLIKLETPRAR